MARNFVAANNDRLITAVNFNVPSQVSVSAWVNVTSFPASGYGCVFSHSTGSASGYVDLYVTASGHFAWYCYNISPGTLGIDPGTFVIPTGTWVHACLVYSSATGLASYVNGVSDGTLSASGSLATPSVPVCIAEDPNFGRYFTGQIADVGYWNIPLTSANAVSLAAGARPAEVNSANLIGWWPLQGTQSPEPDQGSGGRPLTASGNTTGPVQSPMPPAILRGARSFNGTSDKIITPVINSGSAQPCTIACWFQVAAANPNGSGLVYNGNNNAGGDGYGIYLTSANAIQGTCRGVVGNVPVSSPATVSTNTWYHVAMTITGGAGAGVAQLYLNGATSGAAATGLTFRAPTISGQAGTSLDATPEWHKGLIADWAIWNIALSGAQITSLFNGVRPISVSGGNLVGWWPFDGLVSSMTELDQSGGGNNGTCTGTSGAIAPPVPWRISG